MLSSELYFSLKLDLPGGKRNSEEERISVTETSLENLTLSLAAGFLSGQDHWHLDKPYFPEFMVP